MIDWNWIGRQIPRFIVSFVLGIGMLTLLFMIGVSKDVAALAAAGAAFWFFWKHP